jgi:hypothetical protein
MKTVEIVSMILVGWFILLGVSATSHAQIVTNAPPGVSIRFLSVTNTVRGAAAIFAFTNAAPQKVFFQVTSFEYMDQGIWKTAPPARGASLSRAPDGSYRVQNSNLGFAAGVGFSRALPPSTTVTQAFEIHDTNLIWRIQAFCVEEATGLPGLVERGKEVIKKVQTGKEVEILSGKKYIATAQTNPINGQQDDAPNDGPATSVPDSDAPGEGRHR